MATGPKKGEREKKTARGKNQGKGHAVTRMDTRRRRRRPSSFVVCRPLVVFVCCWCLPPPSSFHTAVIPPVCGGCRQVGRQTRKFKHVGTYMCGMIASRNILGSCSEPQQTNTPNDATAALRTLRRLATRVSQAAGVCTDVRRRSSFGGPTTTTTTTTTPSSTTTTVTISANAPVLHVQHVREQGLDQQAQVQVHVLREQPADLV